MSKWIDGEWLLNFFEPYPDDYQTPLGTLKACVDDAPTIDAVSVVRCKECKNNYNKVINHGKMQPRCDFTDRVLTENDYCSRGERKDQ